MFNVNLLTAYFDRIKYPEGGNKYYLYEDVWADYAKDMLTSTFLYVAIALLATLAVIAIVIRAKKPEALPSFGKTAITICMTFAVTVIITMLAIGFGKISEKGYAKGEGALELIPPIALGGVIVLGVIVSYVCSLFNKKAGKIATFVSLGLIVAALVATIVCSFIYFSHNIKGDGYYDDGEYGQLNVTALWIGVCALVAVAVALAFVCDKDKAELNSRCIALAGITVALSFALSYIKMFTLPQGGSITLVSLLPVMLFAYVYGPKKGLLVGLIYGMMQAMQDAYVIHPAQFLLDYPIAFSMVAFAGILKNVKALDKLPQVKFVLGAIAVAVLRFASHLLSGVFAFGAYAMDAGMTNFWAYSAAYNSFVFVDMAIVVVVGSILFSSKAFLKQITSFAK